MILGGEKRKKFTLSSADSYTSDVTAMMQSQMSAGPTNAAANIEDRCTFGQAGAIEKQLYQLYLGFFLGIFWCEKVAVMNVFAPGELACFCEGDRQHTKGYSSSHLRAHSGV